MYDKVEVQEAIRNSIQTEKNAMDFYRLAASHMKDQAAQRDFMRISHEERTHARRFYNIYLGSDIPNFDDFMSASPAKESYLLSELEKLIVGEFDERKAFNLAMKKEFELEKQLREKAANIEDPDIRKVYEMNARWTNEHCLFMVLAIARLDEEGA